MYAGLIGEGEDLQILHQGDIGAAYLCVAGVRHIENIVQSTHEWVIRVERMVRKNAEHLFFQRILGNAVVVIQPGLRAPADMEGGIHVCFAPFHNFAELFPIIHLFKGEMLHRRAGNNHAVKFFLAYIVKDLVKFEHMLSRGVFRFMRSRLQQLYLHLKRRVAQQAQQLCFGFNFGRHQVENQNPQRPDILRKGARFRHDENILQLQAMPGRQLIINFDWHGPASPSCRNLSLVDDIEV